MNKRKAPQVRFANKVLDNYMGGDLSDPKVEFTTLGSSYL